MSSYEAADDAEDPGQVSFILMRASETFDGQDRVMSRAAYDLQVLATAHSASCGHPGFVPDEYLAGLSMESTITENTGATWITPVLSVRRALLGKRQAELTVLFRSS